MTESCKTSYWWPGYPMVLSAGGGPVLHLSSARLRRPRCSRWPYPTTTQGRWSRSAVDELVMAAGLDLLWRPHRVQARTEAQTVIPIPAITIMGR